MVQAPPGTGKTTLVPPAVAALVGASGRVVVTQPRRIAARAAARRIAHLLGEPVGQTVGYAVRGDRRTSAATRIEVVTTGVLLRRLQRDPALPGVAAVVLDEVHERQLDADLTLALLVDVRENLRDDLLLVAMSATVEAARTSALLDDAPVVAVSGSLHPVAEVWCPLPTGVRRSDDRGVTPRFLDHVAACVRRALAEQPGDVLVFVPGVAEVSGVVRRLGGVGRRRAPAARAADGGRAGPGADRRSPPPGRRVHGGRRVLADRARGAHGGGRGAVPRAAHRPPARARRPGDRRGQPGGGRAAGRARGARGRGGGVPLLVAGRARPPPRAPRSPRSPPRT